MVVSSISSSRRASTIHAALQRHSSGWSPAPATARSPSNCRRPRRAKDFTSSCRSRFGSRRANSTTEEINRRRRRPGVGGPAMSGRVSRLKVAGLVLAGLVVRRIQTTLGIGKYRRVYRTIENAPHENLL
jgi:hypothetical protein